MKGKRLLATGLTAAVTLSSMALPTMSALEDGFKAVPETVQPNIIFVMMDDTGYGELGCYGNTFNETPNMDALAAAGARFNQFYTQPVCSPSRGCLMTGNNPLRNGVSNYLDDVSGCLDPNEFESLPQMLNRAGYHTGIIGKWHLSASSKYSYSPATAEKHNWDEVLMSDRKNVGAGDYFYPYGFLPHVTGRPQNKFLVDDMNEEAVAYIERNANQDEPFMLYLAHYATHTTLDAPAETVNYFQKKRGSTGSKTTNDRNPYMAAMLKHIDDGIGMIDDKLEELGIKDNTLIVIAGDNGGEMMVANNGHLRAGKWQLYDGGIRNPMIMRWPNTLASGQTIEFPTSMIDFYETFADISDLEVEETTGISLLPLIEGTGIPNRDVPLYWTYPRNTDFNPGYTVNNTTALLEGGAIRIGDYKYLQSFAFEDRRELYNLAEDPSEKTNIIADHPDLYHQMCRELHERLAADTVGKVFTASFETGESYRWRTSGTFTRDKTCKTSGASLKIMTVIDYLYYDADITVDVQADDKGSAGIIFRSCLANPSNAAFRSYAAVINVKEDKVQLLEIRSSETKVLASVDYDLSPEKTYNLKVSTDSDEIKIYVDDEHVLTTYDESYINGSFGFVSNMGSATFDNFVITGKQRTRPLSEQQLNIRTDNAINVKADNQWVWFENEPTIVGEETFVQADAVLDTLGFDYTYENQTLTTSSVGQMLSCTVGSTTATINGEAVTLAAAPTEENGHIMVPLSLLKSGLDLQVSTSDSTIIIDSSRIISYYYNSPEVTYSPASAWSVVGSIKRSARANASVTIPFNGTGVELYLDRGDQAGKFDVYIDGEIVADNINAYNSGALSHSLMFKVYDLTPGEHTFKLVNVGEKGASNGGYNINFNELRVYKDAKDLGDTVTSTTLLYDTDSRIEYSSGWSVINAGAAYGATTTRSTAQGASATLTFSGTGIGAYFGRGTGAGIFEVILDGESQGEIDSYNSNSVQKSKLYENLELADGEHTIQIINTGKKNTVGTATNINLDAFEITRTSTEAIGITSFTIPNQIGETVIDEENGTIEILMPYGTDIARLQPRIVVPYGATVAPATRATVDCTDPVRYTLLSENGLRKIYTLTVKLEDPLVESVSLISALNLNKGDSYLFAYSITSSAAEVLSMTWTSSNPKVATIDSNGNLKALSSGTTTVTLRVDGIKNSTATASCTVKVSTPATDIKLSAKSITLHAGKSKTLTATVTPANATNKTITMRSQNTKIAKVSGNKIVGVKAGTTYIVVSADSVSKSVKVTVKSKVTKITFKKKKLTVKGKKSVDLKKYFKKITPQSKYRLSTKYTWTTGNKKTVKVSKKGIAKAVRKNKWATITVKSGKTVLGKIKVKFA